jgi:hypothetical protein
VDDKRGDETVDGLYAAMERNEAREAKRVHQRAKPYAGELVILLQRIIELSGECERAMQAGDRPGFLSWAERRDVAIFAASDFIGRHF